MTVALVPVISASTLSGVDVPMSMKTAACPGCTLSAISSYELVVDTNVAHLAAESASRGAESGAKPRHPEDEPDEHAPERTRERTG